MSAPEEQADGADAARELTQQAQELAMYPEPPASALDRVLAWADSWRHDTRGLEAADILAAQQELIQLRADLADARTEAKALRDAASSEAPMTWVDVPFADWKQGDVANYVAGFWRHQHAIAIRERDDARADLADVGSLEAWLRERYEAKHVAWEGAEFEVVDSFRRVVAADSLPALGAAVATEGK